MQKQNDVNLRELVHEKAKAAKRAVQALAQASTEQKNKALLLMADALWEQREAILQANEQDVQAARESEMEEGRIDRLFVDAARLQQMMTGLRQVADLPDPIGELLETITRADGLRIEKVRVAIGVIAMIFESRPNVTVDATGLALKTGNAVILRGGKEALHTNGALVDAMKSGLQKADLPPAAIQFIERTERETVTHLIQAKGLVDLAIPRGGAGLIANVVANAQVPILETGVGNCHVYVDAAADLVKAQAIVLNAKTQRPSVCNAMETLLVHQAVAEQWLPQMADELIAHNVQIKGCPRTLQLLSASDQRNGRIAPAVEADWGTEYLDLVLAVRVVDSLEAALDHIETYGTRHSEAIVTEDAVAAERFLQCVDAAAVYHNASTRFTDGYEFGFGAEIGISTQKLHARGPMGLKELTSYKYLIRGNGQVRN